MVEAYEKLHSRLHLTSAHRQELKRKRGFTDQTIDILRFVSGGKYVQPILEALRAELGDETMLQAGLYHRPKGTTAVLPCDQILDDRIIIPYLNVNNEITLLRPHKLGLPEIPIQVYCGLLLANNPEHIVITEGEFKAAALYQWGIPAIAIPGISSFCGKHFDRLVDVLKAASVKSVTVIFDNEIKDDPKYPNYKEKPEDRWDTPYWAYILAWKLHKNAGLGTRIGQLPDAWRVNGKIDFDGALAQGRKKGDIEAVIANAYMPSEYLDSLPDEVQKIVRRKLKRYFMKSPIRREHNTYVIAKQRGTDAVEETLSNFVIDIKASFFGPEGCVRHVQLVNEYGEKSEVFVLEPDQMAGVNEFKKFCFSKGNYVFEGTGADLTEVWKFELGRDVGDMIRMPEQIGELSKDFWLFGNTAVKNGQVYVPDQDGIFWVDGIGYKPQSLMIGATGENAEDAIPSLYTGENAPTLKEIADVLYKSVGGYQACVALGWTLAIVFSNEIFEEYKFFPFLFLHGKRESGKSTLAGWLMAFWGVESEGYNLQQTTENFVMRALGYFSSMPIWFDEYRNEQAVTRKDGYFRSAFNRQLSGKGIKSSFGARSYKVSGTVLFSGEELPKDSGLFTRVIPLQVSTRGHDRDYYDWLNLKSEKFSRVTFDLIKNKDKLKGKVLETIRKLRQALVQNEITDRTAISWAIAVGTYCVLVKKDPDLVAWTLEACKDVRKAAEGEHILNVFLDDVEILLSDGAIRLDQIAVANDRVYMWYKAVYAVWAEHYRRRTGKEPFDRMSILKYLKDEPYFDSEQTFRLGNSPRWCLALDPSKDAEDGQIRSIAQSVEARQAYASEQYKSRSNDWRDEQSD